MDKNGKSRRPYKRRYTEEERIHLWRESLKYPSAKEAAKELGISFTLLKKWMEKYDFTQKALEEKEVSKRKMIEVVTNSQNDLLASLQTGMSASQLHEFKKANNLLIPKYSEGDKTKIVEQSLEYATTLEAAKCLGIPYTSLINWRKERGVGAIKRKRVATQYSEEQKKWFAEESVKYKNLTSAATHLGIATRSLSTYCKKFGVPIKRLKVEYSEGIKNKALEMLKKGTSKKEVASELKVPSYRLREWLKLDAEGKL